LLRQAAIWSNGKLSIDHNRIYEYIKQMKTTARMFKALSDETRLRILCLLLDGELCVCHIMAVLQLPQSTVSRHLAFLKNSGWVDDRREGVWMYYSISDGDSEIRMGLIDNLRRCLPKIPAAAADRERLKIVGPNGGCM